MNTKTPSDERLDVVAVAPHPDDVEILCGGTVAKLAQQGYRVGIIDLTTGEPTPRGSEEIRAQEAEKARQVLGVHVRLNLRLPNRELMDDLPARYALATALRRARPQLVIGLAGRTPAASPDHHQGHLLIEAARFYSQLTKWDERFDGTAPYRIPHLVYVPVPFDAEQRTWHSTIVVDVAATFAQKLDAIRCYASQFDDERFDRVQHWVSGQGAAIGARCGLRYGELFALPHPLGVDNLVRTVQGGRSSPAPVELPGRDNLPLG